MYWGWGKRPWGKRPCTEDEENKNYSEKRAVSPVTFNKYSDEIDSKLEKIHVTMNKNRRFQFTSKQCQHGQPTYDCKEQQAAPNIMQWLNIHEYSNN